jgi:hypothetical protein
VSHPPPLSELSRRPPETSPLDVSTHPPRWDSSPSRSSEVTLVRSATYSSPLKLSPYANCAINRFEPGFQSKKLGIEEQQDEV